MRLNTAPISGHDGSVHAHRLLFKLCRFRKPVPCMAGDFIIRFDDVHSQSAPAMSKFVTRMVSMQSVRAGTRRGRFASRQTSA
jgi:hypothetical protein